MKKILIVLLAIASGLGLWGCYTNTIDSLSTFRFQLPIYFYQNWVDRAAPDTSWDFTNLNDYPEYRRNELLNDKYRVRLSEFAGTHPCQRHIKKHPDD